MENEELMKELIATLREVINAWEDLPGRTNYSPSVIGSWLQNSMSPAINKARSVIKRSKM